jgi:hypothetical protein
VSPANALIKGAPSGDRNSHMSRPPTYRRYLPGENVQSGFSSIAPAFWRTAEQLRDEAVQKTAGQSWPAYWTIHSTICLYQAALDCFINEEITIYGAFTGTPMTNAGYQIQGDTLCAAKLDAFFAYFGLKGQQATEVQRRTLLLAGLRNRLSHHWPEMRDIRDYPVQVIDALNDAHIERVNTSWTGQCSDVRLAKWAAEVVRAFVDEWWRIGRTPDGLDRAHWEFGPKLVYPSDEPVAPSKS